MKRQPQMFRLRFASLNMTVVFELTGESPPNRRLPAGEVRIADNSIATMKSHAETGEFMALKIVKVSDDLYSVIATPPDVNEEWSPPEPLRGRRLTRELIERGAHQVDVGDAMYEADPDWIRKLRDPYIPPSTK